MFFCGKEHYYQNGIWYYCQFCNFPHYNSGIVVEQLYQNDQLTISNIRKYGSDYQINLQHIIKITTILKSGKEILNLNYLINVTADTFDQVIKQIENLASFQ